MSGSSLSLNDAGLLSQAAYQDLENGSIIDGYMLVDHVHDLLNRFRGQVWQSLSNPNSVVFAFGGTDPNAGDIGGDLKTDYELANGELPSQFTEAVSFYNNYLTKNADATFISVTGHSLGGGLAEYVSASPKALVSPNGGITFEAPGIKGIQGVGQDASSSLINYVNVNDPVGNFTGLGSLAYTDQHVGSVTFFATPNIVYQAALSLLKVELSLSDSINDILVAAPIGILAVDAAQTHGMTKVAPLLGIQTYTGADIQYTKNEYFASSPVAIALQDFGHYFGGLPSLSAASYEAYLEYANPQLESQDQQSVSFSNENVITISWAVYLMI